jgi:hypothetical protein
MEPSRKPSKEAIRLWLQQRQCQRTPVPDIEQIRREVGWSAPADTKPCQQDPAHGATGLVAPERRRSGAKLSSTGEKK